MKNSFWCSVQHIPVKVHLCSIVSKIGFYNFEVTLASGLVQLSTNNSYYSSAGYGCHTDFRLVTPCRENPLRMFRLNLLSYLRYQFCIIYT